MQCPYILEQAALVRSDRPQFLSYFTLQTAYSTVVPTGGRKHLFFFSVVFAITVFNVSFIFTAVPVATARNRSAYHILLLQDKGSSSLRLGSETSRDKRSWVSVFSPLLFFTNLAKCFSTCTAQLKRLPMPCVFEKSEQTHHLVLQGWDCWGSNTGSLLTSLCYCGFVSASQGALGLVDIVVHSHHEMPAWVCCCHLSQTPKMQHWHMAANPLLHDPRLLILALLLTPAITHQQSQY